MSHAVAALAVAMGVVLIAPATGWRPAHRAQVPPDESAGATHRPIAILVVVMLAGLALWGALADAALGLLVIVGAGVGLVRAERTRASRRRAREQAAQRTEEYVLMLSVELSAGRAPAEALAAATPVGPQQVAQAAGSYALGGDPVPALRAAAARPGCEALGQVAAAWQLAIATGAPLADVLRRTTQAVRDDLATDREVAEQLAPVRATGRVLAGLPLMGVVVGSGLGVNVPALLLLTAWGQASLVAALALVACGLWVIDRISEHTGSAR